MNQSFDKFNRYEIPTMVLCQPDKTPIFSMGDLFDRQLNLRFNGLSEFSFGAKSKIKSRINGTDVVMDTPYYSYLDYKRLVYIQDIGYFMITGIENDADGFSDVKKITAQSLEVELNFKKLSLFKGTYQFYDLIDPAPTLLGTILQYVPDWSIGHVDTELTTLYRTFDETDITIYGFLMEKVSQTYDCIFSFDTINKVISVRTVANATTPTDIYLSFENLVENSNLTTITEELCTALNVLGSDPLSIRTVNPLGTDTIYNFTYYKNTNWMSASLVTAVTNWENTVTSFQAPYASLLTILKNQNILLLEKQAELSALEGEKAVLDELRTVKIRQGLDISVVSGQINAKQSEIDAKNAEIAVLESDITATNTDLATINNAVSFSTNFTATQFRELSNFIVGSTYTNTNFIQTDIMTPVEIQDQSQALYDQAIAVLAKISEPRYTFDINSINFVFLKEYQVFINQLVLGAVVTVKVHEGVHTYPAVLGFDLDYDNPEQFKIILSNRLRLDDSAFQFSDLFSQSISNGITTQFNSEIWSNFQDNYKNDVSYFINNALNVASKAIVDAKNQSFILDSNGIRGRYLDPDTNQFSPEQLGIINNLIVFTDDNWDSAKLALGKVVAPSGSSTFGLVAEVIVGNLIAGNKLYISNDSNTFTVDGSGATLTNAKFTLFGNQEMNKIVLDPTKGIEISKKSTSGSYAPMFYVDTAGNIIFEGVLNGASGFFSGEIRAKIGNIGAWTIDDFGLKDIYGNYIYGNGSIKLGALRIDGSEAWFDGNIYARNLQDYVQGTQIKNIIADTITAGTLRGIDIFGKNIYWPGVRMYSPFEGFSDISATNTISIYVNGPRISEMTLSQSYAKLLNDVSVEIGSANAGGKLDMRGSIETMDSNFNSGWGWSTQIPISTGSSTQLLTFVNGILVDPFRSFFSASIVGGGSPGTISGTIDENYFSGALDFAIWLNSPTGTWSVDYNDGGGLQTSDPGGGTVASNNGTGVSYSYIVSQPTSGWSDVDQFSMNLVTGDGAIPSLPTMVSATYFNVYSYNDVAANTGWYGNAPTLIGWAGLQQYWIERNGFTGNMPSLPDSLNLTRYEGNQNKMSGNVADLSHLTNLVYLRLANNQFTGYNVGSLTTQTSLQVINLAQNAFTQQAVDDILQDCVTSLSLPGRVTARLDIDGGTTSAPSASGLVNKGLLQDAGWTVWTN